LKGNGMKNGIKWIENFLVNDGVEKKNFGESQI
jgi:hypothetical protein